MTAPRAEPVRQRESGPAVRSCKEGWEVVGFAERIAPFRSRKAAEAELARRVKAMPSGSQPRERACMCCGSAFKSTGPGHRLCGTCRHKDPGPVAMRWARARRPGEAARA
ncbi:MAG: hypothetical protein KF887_06940 [Paracoccaceae bacterium]|nr:MAG: hypothetical protein KF887_06940 [Paracoccaceae bacterium]